MTTAKYRKIVILGHISVGKTALVLQFVKGEFPKLYEPTIENTYNKSFVLEMEEYNLTVVDTASHLEFSFLPPSFFIGVDGYIVVYSVDSLTSFQMASVLHQKLEERRGKGCRQVSPLEGLRLADAWKAPFLEVSATDPKETKQIFIELIKEIDRIERNFNKKKKCNIL
ncbi:GTPase RhebL1-like isoform 2-T2 [Mantella aurantiaca]